MSRRRPTSTVPEVAPTDLPLFRAAKATRPTSRNLAGAAPGDPTPLVAKPPPSNTAKNQTKTAKPSRRATSGATHLPMPRETPPTPAAMPTPVPHATTHAATVDSVFSSEEWALVKTIRDVVSDLIRQKLNEDELSAGLNKEKHEGLTRQWVDEELTQYNNRLTRAGNPALDSAQRTKLTGGVIDAIFGLGRLDALLRLPGIEDIAVRGCDQVSLMFADGRREKGPPVADSDEELIADIRHWATINPSGERQFSSARKQLDLSLPNGDRLSASAWFTHRPTVTIRRHTLVDIDLSTMLDFGAIDPGLKELIACATLSGVSIVFSGLPKSGKTTLMRAALNELDPMVPLATIETEYELGLHRLPHRHHNVWPAQIIQGGEDGAGAFGASDAVIASLRQTVDRVIVGEVRSHEVLDMLDAMTAGTGSMSSVHSRTPREAVDRLASLATRAGPNVTTETALRQIGSSIDLIVQIGVIDETPIGGKRHRFVSHIDALRLGGDSPTGIEHHEIYKPGPDGRAVPTGLVPEWIDDIEMYGYDRGWLQQREGGWAAPLQLLRPRARKSL